MIRNDLPDERKACIRVMVELMSLFEDYKKSITFVGGWVPYFLLDHTQDLHIGSKDIDIAFDLRKLPKNAKKSILQILKDNNFIPAQEDQPSYVYYMRSPSPEGFPFLVKIDFLTGKMGAANQNLVDLQDIKAFNAPGCIMAFDDSIQKKISVDMPDGSVREVELDFANIIPFLVMKGQAIASVERNTKKDAYDIYFTIKNFPGGVEKLAKLFSVHMDDGLVCKSLANIQEKFNEPDTYATQAVANLYRIKDERSRREFKQSVFEMVNDFFQVLEKEYGFSSQHEKDHIPDGPDHSME